MKSRTNRALRRFGFRQTIRGAIILGLFVGLMMGAQGAAFAAAYPDEHSRQGLVSLLKTTPAFNFLSGEIKNAAEPRSYSIYKSLPLVTLVGAIWGLLVTTRLLRGNEEDGRLEMLLAGQTTKRRTSSQLIIGFCYSLAVAGLLTFGIIAALGADPQVGLTVSEAGLLTLAVFLPGLVFGAAGILTSQLTTSRGRAVVYGLVPLLVLYVIRGAANTTSDLDWLKTLSPFGWSDRLDAILDPHVGWLALAASFAGLFVGASLYFAGRRDFDSGLLHQTGSVRSHFHWLGSPLRFAMRQNTWTFIWWAIGTIAYTSFMAAVAGVVVEVAHNSSLKGVLSTLPDDQVKIMFLGFDTMILTLIMLGMATIGLSALRRDEAKGYLDNLLVQPVRRDGWLITRLGLIVAMTTVIALLATSIAWVIATTQNIDVGIGTMMEGAVSLTGIIVLVLGTGALLYGLWPRVAVMGMVAVIAWAFIVDILKGLFHLDDIVQKTSVLYYIPKNPSKAPDWMTVGWLFAIGILLAVIGIYAFRRRDVVAE